MRHILFFFFILSGFLLRSEVEKLPYTWSYEVEELGQGKLQVKAICELDSGYHLYAFQNNPKTTKPTLLHLLHSADYKAIGGFSQPEADVKHDELFDEDLYLHKGRVVYVQEVERKTDEAFLLAIKVQTQACQDDGKCTIPEEFVERVEIKSGAVHGQSVWWIFIAGALAGLFALLTPCVFPLIPLTVTFFTKGSESRSKAISKALVYGVSIVVIYVSLGIGVTLFFGESALNQMSSSPFFNFLFFIVLLVFAVSFLGAFEITMPSFLVNKVDAKADKGGWVGIFFMAFALALVSFSCTGPLVGTLLVEASANAGVTGPFLGMLGFGLALALPFTLFAIFPSWINSLPKSGSWLNKVKVTLGLLELALALKFLSNADLVYHHYFLPRELFVLLWMIVFAMIALYLLGAVQLFKKKASGKSKTPLFARFVGVFSLLFVVYLAPGLKGGDLKLLSGVLPPVGYSWSQWGSGVREVECPNGLDCEHHFEAAVERAKKEGKPLLVDFTGFTCVNCRFMEQNIWSVPAVDSLIRNEYVVVSLYCDDRHEFDKNIATEKELALLGKNEVESYGELWSFMQADRYGSITQPLYVLLDHEEQLLVPKFSYTTSAKKYRGYLEKGIEEFRNRIGK